MMKTNRATRLLLASAIVATCAHAQDTTVRACDRPADGRFPAAFYGQLVTIPKADVSALGYQYLHDLLEAIRQSLRPGPLGLGVYNIWPGHAALSGATTVIFSLTQQGAVRDLVLAASSLSPELDREVYDAVKRADSAQLILPLPANGQTHAKFYLTVYIAQYPDTTTHPDRWGLVEPLMTTALPGWQGDITQPGPSTDHPRYPELGRAENVEDSLLVRFVVDEHGRVVPSSVFFEAGTYQEFAKSIRDWLPHAQYSAGRIGKCAVKSLAKEWFRYQLSH